MLRLSAAVVASLTSAIDLPNALKTCSLQPIHLLFILYLDLIRIQSVELQQDPVCNRLTESTTIFDIRRLSRQDT